MRSTSCMNTYCFSKAIIIQKCRNRRFLFLHNLHGELFTVGLQIVKEFRFFLFLSACGYHFVSDLLVLGLIHALAQLPINVFPMDQIHWTYHCCQSKTVLPHTASYCWVGTNCAVWDGNLSYLVGSEELRELPLNASFGAGQKLNTLIAQLSCCCIIFPQVPSSGDFR